MSTQSSDASAVGSASAREKYPPQLGEESPKRGRVARNGALPFPAIGLVYRLKPDRRLLAVTCKVSWIDGDGIHGRYARENGSDAGSFYNFTPALFWGMVEAVL